MGATLGKTKSSTTTATVSDVKSTTANGADVSTTTFALKKQQTKKQVKTDAQKLKPTKTKSKKLSSSSKDTKATMTEAPTNETVNVNTSNYDQSAVAHAHGVFLSTDKMSQSNGDVTQVNNAFVGDNPIVEDRVRSLTTVHHESTGERDESVAPEILQLRQACANFKFGDSIDQAEPTSPIVQLVPVEDNERESDERTKSPPLTTNETVECEVNNEGEQQTQQDQQQQSN
ncbi:unnamed protein product [Didymodactylos carnosus]|uniref:Uncharacterized protein n=1 Tax=Didymodactylos carnosus TaxID=1234261 RepID=A0A814G1J4_9BILA|nr:unnamed protein product [Didymodactylos carnosus]CAF0987708.1 unnamed protein product [Didymodactylos carnosus]CAF3543803.1 unnamed protein product [Didymodactylos carnosus]CAF3759891.1 unnamed protein product [Didymodactylos carnosus]